MKYVFYDLIIEVTRNCNMECSHCLRGDTEDSEIDLFSLMKLFEKTKMINTISFSGGEPSLAVEKIRRVLNLAKKYDIEIQNFYIATNGKEVSNDFLLCLLDLYIYCSDNEISSVEISTDAFHEKVKEENIKKLKIFSFFNGHKGNIDSKESFHVIPEGRGKNCHNINKNFLYTKDFQIDIFHNEIIFEEPVYINVYGEAFSECNLSYDSQRKIMKTKINDIDENEEFKDFESFYIEEIDTFLKNKQLKREN